MYVTILEDWLTFHLQKVRIILEFRVKRTDCKSSNIDRSFTLQSCYKIDLPKLYSQSAQRSSTKFVDTN